MQVPNIEKIDVYALRIAKTGKLSQFVTVMLNEKREKISLICKLKPLQKD
jgi:hypothetical protein